jgi:hypothetical protein
VVVAILRKGESVRSSGSYLCGLTEKARGGEFPLGPKLMTLPMAKLQSCKAASGSGHEMDKRCAGA